jgi:anti-anti-sigma factor
VNQSNAIKTIRFSGELEIGRKKQIREALQYSNADRAVLVDLSEVTYADSIALTELLRFCVDAERAAIPVVLLVCTPQFARIVQYAGLARAFKTFEDRDAAIAYLLERLQA